MRGVCLYLKNGHSLGRVATSGYRHGRQKPKLQIKMVASPGFGPIFAIVARNGAVFGIGGFEFWDLNLHV